jgi:CO/xanthine dehydrogenase Mo-binding subunit
MKQEANGEKILTRLTLGESEPSPAATPGESPRRHDVDVIFVDERDQIVNPLGVNGLGEIGLVGVTTAIANAIYHATGKRVRDLPVTLDKLL